MVIRLSHWFCVFQSKRCNVHVAVGWFFRPSEVPESVYDHLVQDRGVERGE